MDKITLNEKLSIIQSELKTKKSRFNAFGKYHFRSAEDILEAIKPFLVEYNVTVRIREKLISDGVIQSIATITDGLNKIHSTAIVGVDMEQKGMAMPQRYGSASSYGKKYALGNLFLIDDTNDPDATNDHGEKSSNTKSPEKSPPLPKLESDTPQFKRVVEGLKRGYTFADVEKKYIISDDVKKLINNQL